MSLPTCTVGTAPWGLQVLSPRTSPGPCGTLTAGSREWEVDGPETGQAHFAHFFLSSRGGAQVQREVWKTFCFLTFSEHLQNQSFSCHRKAGT